MTNVLANHRGGSGLALAGAALLVLAVSFSILPDGFAWNRDSADIDAATGSFFRRLQWMPLFLLAAYILWRRRVLAFTLVRDMNPLLVAFVAYAALTMLWSPYPGITLRKIVILLGTVMVGLAPLVAGWYPDRHARLIRITFTAMLVLSVLLAVLVPRLGVMQEGVFAGNWRGAADHKNQLAGIASVGVVVWVHAWAARHVRPGVALAGIALAFLCLIMSGGKTGLVTAVMAMPIVWFVVRPPVEARYLMPATALLTAVLIVVPVFLFMLIAGRFPTWTDLVTPVALAVGKDPSLTGRDDLWVLMWAQIQDHWLLGYGYDTFWLGMTGPSGEIAETLYWLPWQAHNGYIDLINEVGVLGGALYLGFLVVHLLRIRRLAEIDRANAGLHLGIVVVVLMANVSESSLFAGTRAYWMLLLFSALAADRALSPRVHALHARIRGEGTGTRVGAAQASSIHS